jgi:hypothetical protein
MLKSSAKAQNLALESVGKTSISAFFKRFSF